LNCYGLPIYASPSQRIKIQTFELAKTHLKGSLLLGPGYHIVHMDCLHPSSRSQYCLGSNFGCCLFLKACTYENNNNNNNNNNLYGMGVAAWEGYWVACLGCNSTLFVAIIHEVASASKNVFGTHLQYYTYNFIHFHHSSYLMHNCSYRLSNL
jgi:hypothetical protein